MTALGTIFAMSYALGFLLKRRLGILATAAAAIPFNDSAAAMLGGFPISPFYLGILIYLPLAYLRFGTPSAGSSVPVILGFWAIIVTIAGPAFFAGMPVVASGVGLDQQVGTLSQLDYSTSNMAQIIYLFLNLSLLITLPNTVDRKPWIPLVPAVVGTLVAGLALFSREAGLGWPEELFHNNSRNAYAYVDTARLTGQFSEPSHLAVFALTSAVILGATIVTQQYGVVVRILLGIIVLTDLILIVETASATALAGAAIFALLVLCWSLSKMVRGRHRISQGAALFGLMVVGLSIALLPKVIDYALGILEYKLATGASIEGRSAADASSWQVFLDSGTLGVGLGSNRSSSLMLLLLSTVGLVGTILFLLLMARAVRDGIAMRASVPFAAGLLALLASSFVSLADLVSPMMWLLACFCWNTRSSVADQRTSLGHQLPGTRRNAEL